jgi:uncharacterized protein YbbK (DUF523 family)
MTLPIRAQRKNPQFSFFAAVQYAQPTITISACLAGEPVRYDGRSKPQDLFNNVDTLTDANLQRMCPEMAAGFGVPRPAVQLQEYAGQLRAIGVADSSLDVSDALRAFSQHYIDNNTVQAYILKSRSPSCGVANSAVHNSQGQVIHNTGSGLFADKAMAQQKSFIIDSEVLTNPAQLDILLDYCYLLLDLQNSTDNEVVFFCRHHNLPNKTTKAALFIYLQALLHDDLSANTF